MTIRTQASKIFYGIKKEAAKISYHKLKKGPYYLPSELLSQLDATYSYDNTVFYDFESNLARAKERFTFLNDKLEGYGKTLKGAEVLELGCGDGLICAIMNDHGSRSTAVDLDDTLFDQYATDRGVKYFTMDATKLKFEDASFDFIFSHNGFEHFSDPEAVYNECNRVLKPGGMMYFQFNPLYYSPFGYHGYKSIAIPYLHILFSQNDFTRFAKSQNRPELYTSPDFLNKKQVGYFRDLFNNNTPDLKVLFYEEEKNNYFVDLIRKFPSCFKKENVPFENFITSGIRIWVKKSI